MTEAFAYTLAALPLVVVVGRISGRWFAGRIANRLLRD